VKKIISSNSTHVVISILYNIDGDAERYFEDDISSLISRDPVEIVKYRSEILSETFKIFLHLNSVPTDR